MLTLIRDKIINSDNSPYGYYTGTFDDLKTKMKGTNNVNVFAEISETNYKYLGEYVEIYKANLIPFDYKRLTYAFVETEETALAFFVTNVTYISGKLRIYLKIDLWGTYYDFARTSYLHIVRNYNENNTHARGSIYTYDNKVDVFDTLIKHDLIDGSVNKKDLFTVFSVLIKRRASTLFSNGSSTAIKTYVLPLPLTGDDNQTIEYKINRISGIFAIAENGSAQTPQFEDANVIKAYILPRAYISSTFTQTGNEYAKIKYVLGGEENTANAYPVKGVTLDLSQGSGQEVENFANDYNAKAYFGTNTQKFEITRTNKEEFTQFKIITRVLQDGLQILARIDGTEYDLTESFSVTITSNNGNELGIDKIGKVLNKATQVLSGISQIGIGIATENPVGVISGSVTLGNAVTGVIRPESNGNIVQGGDALTTYGELRNSTYYEYPLKWWEQKSLYDDTDFFLQNGAKVDDYTNSLIAHGREFIKCDRVHLNGLPQDASDYITALLLKGIIITTEIV